MSPLLTCRGVDVSYGPVQVLFEVDLDVADGEIVALLGTNGAGKSTILKTVSGLLRPTAGTVDFDGHDLTRVPPERIPRLGIVHMPGGRGVFPTMTVGENLRVAGWLLRQDRARLRARLDEAIALFPVLSARAGQLAGDLSGGEQQMLALAQCFMHEPRLLVIDELSLGLAPAVVGQLLDVVRTIHAAGTTIILVEQSVNVALTLAERAVFLEKGEVRFEGPTADLLARPDILRSVFIAGASDSPASADTGAAIRAVTTGEAADQSPRPGTVDREVLLECKGVTRRFGGITAVDSVDLTLHRGEILGLIGQNGAGKTTLLDCVSGFHPLDDGCIVVDGQDVTEWSPHWRALRGLARSFQEARLYPTLTTTETITVALERHLASREALAAVFALPGARRSERAARHRADELVELLGLGAYRDKLLGELSTGTRRVVELACVLAQEPTVVLLDEPSAGVAQRETEELGPLLRRIQAQTGCSMLVIEHDMPLLRAIADRMVALELGAVIAEGSPDEVLEHPRVIASYLGTDSAAINRSGPAGTGHAVDVAATLHRR